MNEAQKKQQAVPQKPEAKSAANQFGNQFIVQGNAIRVNGNRYPVGSVVELSHSDAQYFKNLNLIKPAHGNGAEAFASQTDSVAASATPASTEAQ